jgi:hypothetical protein
VKGAKKSILPTTHGTAMIKTIYPKMLEQKTHGTASSQTWKCFLQGKNVSKRNREHHPGASHRASTRTQKYTA